MYTSDIVPAQKINFHTILLTGLVYFKKVQVGNDQEMEQTERNSHSINQRVGKN